MVKIKITYPAKENVEQLINILNKIYRVIKVSKEYQIFNDKGPHKRIYVDLIQK